MADKGFCGSSKPVRWLDRWQQALAGRRGITFSGSLFTVVIIYLTTVPGELPLLYLERDDHPFWWTLVDTTLGCLALVAGWFVLRFVRGQKARWVIVLAAYLGFGIIRWVIVQLEEWRDLSGWESLAHLLVGCVLGVIALSIPAIAWDYLDRYRRSSRNLSARAYRVDRQSAQLERVHRSVAKTLQTAIDDHIRPTLRQFAAMIAVTAEELGDSASSKQTVYPRIDELSDELRDYSQHNVRALSHDVVDIIDSQRGAVQPAEVPPVVIEVFKATQPTFVRSRPFAPVLFLAMSVAFISLGALGAFGWLRGLGGVLLSCGCGALVLLIADRSLTTRLRRGKLKAQLGWVVGVYLAAAIVAAVLPLPIYNPLADKEYWLIWAVVAFVSVGVFCFLSGMLGTIRYLTDLQSDLRARALTAEWAIEREQFALDQIGMKVSETLHTRVQGRLVAAAANLNLSAQHARAGQLKPQELGNALLKSAFELRNAAASLSADELLNPQQDSGAPGVWPGIAAVVSAWHGVLNIDVECRTQDLDTVNQDPLAADLVVWIVQELASNSFRHGQASRLQLSIGIRGSTVELTGADNGIGLEPQWESGHGLVGLARAGVAVELKSVPGNGVAATVEFELGCVD